MSAFRFAKVAGLLLLSSAVGFAEARFAGHGYGNLPVIFEANQGQTDVQVHFLARGSGYSLFLTGSKAVLALRHSDVLAMTFGGAVLHPRVIGVEPLPGKANYFIGNDPAKWHSNVPTYAKVKYTGVYPGVDLIFYGRQGRLEYDFIVAPHADPDRIAVRFSGTRKLRLDKQGDLIAVMKNGQIILHKPVIYQEVGHKRLPVRGGFELVAENTVRFSLGRYDRARSLVIDPTLAYSTYLGGNGYHVPAGQDCCGDYGSAVAVDSSGNAYVTGVTGSSNFPVSHDAFQPSNNAQDSPGNAFVTKLNAEGTDIVYSTYLGGMGDRFYHDAGKAIAVGVKGAAYVTGFTGSPDFPVTPGAFQKSKTIAVRNAFVTKLSPDGSKLLYSTYLGGDGFNTGASFDGDIATGIAVNNSGNAYVSGTTFSKNFPVTSSAFQRINHAAAINGSNIFVTELNTSGTGLIFSTYLGGSGISQNCCYYFSGADYGTGIALGPEGDAYVTGYAHSKDFPTTPGAFQRTNKAHNSINHTGAYDTNAFITKLNPAGTALVYSTYLGGSGGEYYGDQASGIAVGRSGAAFVTGQAISSDFPITKGAFQLTDRAGKYLHPNAFVTRINTTGTALLYSTFLGGSGGYRARVDSATGIAVNKLGEAYVIGTTYSFDFPVTANAFQKQNRQYANSGADYWTGNVFFTVFNAAGSGLLYSTYLGGSGNSSGYGGDIGSAIAVGGEGNAFLTGYTVSHDFPVSPEAYQRVNKAYQAGHPGATNAFVAKFDLGSAGAQ